MSGKFPAEGWRFEEVLFVPIDQLAGTQTQQGNSSAPDGAIRFTSLKPLTVQP